MPVPKTPAKPTQPEALPDEPPPPEPEEVTTPEPDEPEPETQPAPKKNASREMDEHDAVTINNAGTRPPRPRGHGRGPSHALAGAMTTVMMNGDTLPPHAPATWR